MKTKNIAISIILFSTLVIILFVISIIDFGNKFVNMDDKYKTKIGEIFILEKDTLTIIDYSLFNKTFTLSNGKEVNSNLILNSKTK